MEVLCSCRENLEHRATSSGCRLVWSSNVIIAGAGFEEGEDPGRHRGCSGWKPARSPAWSC